MRAPVVLLIIGCLSSPTRAEEDYLSALELCGARESSLGTCLRLKAVTLLDRALKSGPLVINDFLTLAPLPGVNSSRAGLQTAQEIESSLPQDEEKKDSALEDMIVDKLGQFVSSRSLRFTLSSSDLGQGRGKGYGGGGGGKKGGGIMYLLAFAGVASWFIQLAFAKIALIAGKALLVGKMALLLSAIIGLRKLVGGDDNGHESHQVVYATEAHGGGHVSHGHGWGRSAQELAYSAHAKEAKKQ